MGQFLIWIATLAVIFLFWRAVFLLFGRAVSVVPPWGWLLVGLGVAVWWFRRRRRARDRFFVRSRVQEVSHSKKKTPSSPPIVDTKGEVVDQRVTG